MILQGAIAPEKPLVRGERSHLPNPQLIPEIGDLINWRLSYGANPTN
ncbi:hypothetical protein [Coleofasciculus chthonoplastes]